MEEIIKHNLTMERQLKMDKYRLLYDMPCAKAGAIFVHDKEDSVRGSIGEGCLKLAWTDDGNCQESLVGGAIVLHVKAIRNGEWFEKVIDSPKPTSYRLKAVINALESTLEELKKEIK